MLRVLEESLTFDDVLLVPGYSEITAKDVSLRSKLTRTIELNIPLVSAAMDTVTESRLAISIAQEGGIGIIHKSMSIPAQAAMVRAVCTPRLALCYAMRCVRTSTSTMRASDAVDTPSAKAK